MPESVAPVHYIEEVDKPIDLKYYLFLFRKNLYVVMTFFVIVVTLASVYAARISESYRSMAQIIVEKPNVVWQDQRQVLDLPWITSLPEEYYNTQVELLGSEAVLRPVVQELKLMDYFGARDEESVVGRIRRMMYVKRIPDSRLFNINVTAHDPRFAADLANGIARSYIRKNFEDVLYYSREVLSWLPQEGPPDETISIQDPFGRVTRMTRSDLIESLPAVRGDATLRGLRERKNELMAELDFLKRKYQEKHPLVVKALASLKFLEESIEAEKKRIIDGLKTQAEGKYQVGQARIVQEARIPKGPIPVNRLGIVVGAGAGVLILSFLVIFLLDFFDDTVRSIEDMEKKGLVLPFLGPVAMIRRRRGQESAIQLVSFHDPKSEVGESFRYLRVAINFSASPEAIKTLLVTSCLPHEGKSLIAHNLAISLAQDGNRTLLIDADLRRPVLYRRFRLDNEAGLSNYLTSNLAVDDVVKETFVENLFAIPSGPVSPNPAEILGSEKMKQLLNEARGKFDRVVIDCPPLTGIGDGFVMGSLVGHIVLVIRAGKTACELVKRIQEQLERAKVRIMGTILNQVDMEKERYGGYYKHYYHTYDRYYRKSGEGREREAQKAS